MKAYVQCGPTLTCMYDMAFGMNVIKPLQEKSQVSLEKGQGKSAVFKALLKQPDGLSHWLEHQAYMGATRSRNFETVDDIPHIRKTFVRWISCRKMPREVQLMIRPFFISEIAVIDLQDNVAVALPPPSVKRLERRQNKQELRIPSKVSS